MKAAIIIALLIPLTAESSGPTPAQIAAEQSEVVEYMLEDTAAGGVKIEWAACGVENAWYWWGGGPIHMCLELDNSPAPVFAAAHEAGHALVDGLGLYVDPHNPYGQEQAADELAALFLIEMGKYDAVVGGAAWFMRDFETRSRDGVHPPHAARARELLCLVDGGEQEHLGTSGNPDCLELYRTVWIRWAYSIAGAGQ